MTSFKPDDDVKDKGSEVDYEAGKPGGLPNQSMSPSPLRRLRSRSRRRCHRVTTRPRHRPRSSTSSKRLRDARHTDSNGRLREISRKLWYYLTWADTHWQTACRLLKWISQIFPWIGMKCVNICAGRARMSWTGKFCKSLEAPTLPTSNCKLPSPTMRRQPEKGLPWMPTHLRRFQGHNAYVQKQGRFARMIKQLYP